MANKLGLKHLVLLAKASALRLSALGETTQNFFQKLPGYDTLRLVLCKRAILVEGPSDELVVQRAYRNCHDNRLPIQDGVDVISVGTSFLRFLEVAKALHVPTKVVTDNDGNVDGLERKYKDYIDSKSDGIHICFDPVEDIDVISPSGKVLNGNTLESKILRENGRALLNNVLGTNCASDAELLAHMMANKTNGALAIFDSSEAVKIPQYIQDAVA